MAVKAMPCRVVIVVAMRDLPFQSRITANEAKVPESPLPGWWVVEFGHAMTSGVQQFCHPV
jgi:hypothetical protein